MRLRSLQIVLNIAALMGTITFLLSAWFEIQRGGWKTILLYGLFDLIVIGLAIVRRIPYKARVLGLLSILYCLALAELLRFGASGDGRMELVVMCGLSSIFLGFRFGLFAFLTSLVTQVIIGIGMPLGWIPLPPLTDASFSTSLVDWQTGNLMFALLTGILLGSSYTLIHNLEQSLIERTQLTRELEMERGSLQSKVAEQTADLRREIAERENTEVILRDSEQRLQYFGTHDALTGLYNRSFFETALTNMQREGDFPLSILIMDVDGLKRVNDQFGHTVGDELLKRVGEVMSGALRGEDIIARIGGDEFVVLMPGTDFSAGEMVLQRVHQAIQKHNVSYNDQLSLSLSLGIATAGLGDDLMETIKQADQKMYIEKFSRQQDMTFPSENAPLQS
jgi:diguanylate cyclase (GGDEF)-like protein